MPPGRGAARRSSRAPTPHREVRCSRRSAAPPVRSADRRSRRRPRRPRRQARHARSRAARRRRTLPGGPAAPAARRPRRHGDAIRASVPTELALGEDVARRSPTAASPGCRSRDHRVKRVDPGVMAMPAAGGAARCTGLVLAAVRRDRARSSGPPAGNDVIVRGIPLTTPVGERRLGTSAASTKIAMLRIAEGRPTRPAEAIFARRHRCIREGMAGPAPKRTRRHRERRLRVRIQQARCGGRAALCDGARRHGRRGSPSQRTCLMRAMLKCELRGTRGNG
jgi:hypothetical protein